MVSLHLQARTVAALFLLCFPALLTAQSSRPDWSVLSIAHRGGVVEDYPENTLMAFRNAIDAGMEVIEIDLRSSKDEVIVVLHDSTLDRTTNGRGPVTDWPLVELKKLDAGMGERIPTYGETLEYVAGTDTQLLLDLKVTSVPELTRIVRLTEQQGQVLNVIAAVRSLEELHQIQTLNPNLRTLAFIPSREDIESYSRAGVDIIRLQPEWIMEQPGLIDEIHALGKSVWTTSMLAKKDELRTLMQHGVDGFFTDFPNMVAELKRELKNP